MNDRTVQRSDTNPDSCADGSCIPAAGMRGTDDQQDWFTRRRAAALARVDQVLERLGTTRAAVAAGARDLRQQAIATTEQVRGMGKRLVGK